jgi:hypothetical protein
VIVTALAMPGVARADDDVRVSIAGAPQVGSTLVASATAEDGESVVGTYAWRRCTGAPKKSCVAIVGATGLQYTPTEEDINRRLRVRLTLSGDDDPVDSGPTARVLPAPAQPPPLPPPPPPPISTPLSTPQAPTPIVAPVVSSSEILGAVVRSAPRLMRPVPIVRIAGFLTRRGARITVLSVRAPRGTRISLRCTGDGCPRRALAVATRLIRLRMFERDLNAGTRLEIRVTRTGYIGKHTLIRIRRGKPPARIDRCLYPGSVTPRRCGA